MDGGQLHRLGKRLTELSAAVTGEAGDLILTPGEAAVMEDAIKHPASSIGDISRRTGFTQSHVSASVSRLRHQGLVGTTADPADGRRTRVHAADEALSAIGRRAARRIDDTVARAVTSPARAQRALDLLDELADLLLGTPGDPPASGLSALRAGLPQVTPPLRRAIHRNA